MLRDLARDLAEALRKRLAVRAGAVRRAAELRRVPGCLARRRAHRGQYGGSRAKPQGVIFAGRVDFLDRLRNKRIARGAVDSVGAHAGRRRLLRMPSLVLPVRPASPVLVAVSRSLAVRVLVAHGVTIAIVLWRGEPVRVVEGVEC